MDKSQAPTGEHDDALALRYPASYVESYRIDQRVDIDTVCHKARSLRLNPFLRLSESGRFMLGLAIEDLQKALERKDD